MCLWTALILLQCLILLGRESDEVGLCALGIGVCRFVTVGGIEQPRGEYDAAAAGTTTRGLGHALECFSRAFIHVACGNGNASWRNKSAFYRGTAGADRSHYQSGQPDAHSLPRYYRSSP